MLVGTCVSLGGNYAKDLRVSGWESVCVLLCEYVWVLHVQFFSFIALAMPRGMWDLSSPTRDGTRAPCIGSTES